MANPAFPANKFETIRYFSTKHVMIDDVCVLTAIGKWDKPPPKIIIDTTPNNVAPENRNLEKEILIFKPSVLVSMLVFRGVNFFSQQHVLFVPRRY